VSDLIETVLDDVTLVSRATTPDDATLFAAKNMRRFIAELTASGKVKRVGSEAPRVVIVYDETGASVFRFPDDGGEPIRIAVGDENPRDVAERVLKDIENG
jgi:hypothetical protein